MTTMALRWDNQNARGDLARDGGNLLSTDGLESAVLISLFTDARADETDVDEEMNLRGWWGDQFAEEEGDKIGSRLWTLLRSGKFTEELRQRAGKLVDEALQWMVGDGIAESVEREIFEVRRGIVGIRVAIKRPKDIAPAWVKTWEVSIAL